MEKETDSENEAPIDKDMLDIYSDYLISSFSQATATGLSRMLDGGIVHDKVTQFLSEREYTSKDLWRAVKTTLRLIETEDGAIIIDDSVEEKQYTDENEIVAWHFDHCQGRSVKGINIVSCAYHNLKGTIPLAFEIVKKDSQTTDEKTGETKRKSSKTKNEIMREMVLRQIKNQIKFKYALADSWFASIETIKFIIDHKKHFVFALKDNRLFAPTKRDAINGVFQRVDTLNLKEGEAIDGFLKDFSKKIRVVKQVFTNKDGSKGTLYLVTSDTNLTGAEIISIYQKRWSIEEYHKSIKSNAYFAKSPTRTKITQNNHFFGSIFAFFKLEKLKMEIDCNHFALKSRLYIKALQASFKELRQLQAQALA